MTDDLAVVVDALDGGLYRTSTHPWETGLGAERAGEVTALMSALYWQGRDRPGE